MFGFFKKVFKRNVNKSFDFNDFLQYYKSFNLSPYNINVNKLLTQLLENPFISSALDKMQQGFYAIDWSVFEGEKKEKQEKKENIVYRSLTSPNITMDTNDFLYYCYLYWTIYGEFLIHKQKLFNKYDLWVYAPSEYTIEFYDNILLGIKSIEINGIKYSGKDLENFAYKRIPNLYSKKRGLNRITSLVLLHDYFCLISRWNNSILKNSGKRQFLILLDQLATGETVEKVQDRIMENSGSDGIGKPIVLTGFDENSKIQMLDFAPTDFDYMNALVEIRNITSNVLNVPDLLIGGKDNAKYNNMKEAKEALYTENIIPACKQIKATINRLFSNDFKNSERIDFITEDIEVLKDNKLELINTLNASEIHTVNEKREKLDLDSIPNGNVILIKGMPVTFDEVINGEKEPIDNNSSTEDL